MNLCIKFLRKRGWCHPCKLKVVSLTFSHVIKWDSSRVKLELRWSCASGASRGAHRKFEIAKLKVLARRRHAVLRLSVHESASEVNRSGGDAQVVSRHRYLVIFRLLLSSYNRFPYIWTRSGIVFYIPSPRSRSPFHHAMASWAAHAKRYVNYA